MIYARMFGQLLISEWIWDIAWIFYHNIINILIMAFLLKLFLALRIVPSILISCCAQAAAFLFFNIFVVGILIFGFGIKYDPSQGWSYIPDQFYATFFLGIIYTLLQTVFFLIFNRYYNLHLSWTLVVTLISNSLTVLLVNLLIRTNF